jgi:hypothetical protein
MLNSTRASSEITTSIAATDSGQNSPVLKGLFGVTTTTELKPRSVRRVRTTVFAWIENPL